MQRYQPESSSTYPTDPATNFTSPYPLGFAGCMFCGSSDHVYRLCSENGAPGASAIFYKNLFAHKPHLRKRPPLPSEMLPTPSQPTQSFATPIHLPPPSPSPNSSVSSLPPPPYGVPRPSALKPVDKRAQFFILIAKSLSVSIADPPPIRPPMPIAIDNGLPHITFDLGSDASVDPTLCGLMDTSQDRQILSSCKPVMRIDNRCNLLTIRIQVFRFSNYELYY
jgi:hypothetical protein